MLFKKKEEETRMELGEGVRPKIAKAGRRLL